MLNKCINNRYNFLSFIFYLFLKNNLVVIIDDMFELRLHFD